MTTKPSTNMLPTITPALPTRQVYTSSSTWVKPVGLREIKVTTTGAGAGHGNSSTNGGTSSFGAHCSASGAGTRPGAAGICIVEEFY